MTNVSKKFTINFLYGILFRSPSIFEPRVIILEQLKNSGSLRYFKNAEFQRLVGDLTVTIKNIYDRQELESRQRAQYIDPLIINHYDYDFDTRLKSGDNTIFTAVEKYETNNEIVPYQINGAGKLEREKTINVLSFYKANVISSTRTTFLQKYMEINTKLLNELRKEFYLE